MPAQLVKLRITFWIVFLLEVSAVIGLVEIQNNGYQGLKVAIHKKIPENPQLITALKHMFSIASKDMYQFTKNRAYLKQITIIVPPTWSSKPEYDQDESDECLKCAEVRIAPPAPHVGNIPYTYQPGSCGERGKFIHFTPEFILNNLTKNWKGRHSEHGCRNCDRKAKIFIHEWAHLRYGVFNEHSDNNDPSNPLPKFYNDQKNKITVNGCSENLVGRVRRPGHPKGPCLIDKHGNVDPECNFFPDLSSGQNDKSKVSLMYLPEMDSTYGFCSEAGNGNELKHNPEAPNMHNKMCKSKSVMDIILSNEDFKDGRNPNRTIPNTDPVFNIVQTKKKEITSEPFVLILDVSISMKDRPMQYLQDATKRFLKYSAREQCPIGMVSFHSVSTMLANLTQITDASREELVKKIPTVEAGATAIGKGILEALQLLRKPDGSSQKGKLILITDGEENVTPMIKDILKDVTDSGATIYTVAFGNKASTKLEELTDLTNGKGWQFMLDAPSKSLDSSLNEIGLTCGGDSDMKPFINKNGAFKLESGNQIEGIFRIDKNLGGSTEVTVLLTYDFPVGSVARKAPEVTLVSPSGKVYTPKSPECHTDPATRTFRFRLPKSEHGNWNYLLKNDGPEAVATNLMITSDIVYEDGVPISLEPQILVDSWISDNKLKFPNLPKIYAAVKKESRPVVKAKVIATLYRPIGDSIEIPLLDNGQDPDTVANDGTYTAYVVQFKGSGRYAIDISVENNGEARLIPNRVPGSRAPMLQVLSLEEELEEPKSEFLVSDFEHSDEDFDPVSSPRKKVDYDSMERADVFERFSTGGTFILEDWVDQDLIPPSQVRDLTATITNRTARTVLLEWTSPGDDMNFGQATLVEIKYHRDVTILVHSFDTALQTLDIVNGSLQPPQPSELQTVTVQLPPEEEFSLANQTHVHFALRVYDEEKNGGEVSNFATADFQAPLFEVAQDQTGHKDWTLYIVIGCSLLVVIVLVAAILLYKFCYRKGYQDPSTKRTVEFSALTGKSEDVP